MHAFAAHPLPTRRRPALAVLLASLCAASAAPAATYSARSEVWIVDSLTQHDFLNANQGVGVNSFDTRADGLGATRAMGAAQTDTSGIHLQATSKSDVTGGPKNIYSMGFAQGGFADEFVLRSPSQAMGAAGFATIAFNISGSLGGTSYGGGTNDGLGGGGYSRWHAGLQLYGRNDGISWEGWQSLSVEQDGRQLWDGTAQLGTQVFQVPVIFGDTLRLYMFADVQARTGAQATYPGPGATGRDQSAFFMNTMAWGGILALTDAQGVAVTDFSALSAATGFDYAKPYVSAVPEPAAGWMLLAGGLVLAGVVRRRERRWRGWQADLADDALADVGYRVK